MSSTRQRSANSAQSTSITVKMYGWRLVEDIMPITHHVRGVDTALSFSETPFKADQDTD